VRLTQLSWVGNKGLDQLWSLVNCIYSYHGLRPMFHCSQGISFATAGETSQILGDNTMDDGVLDICPPGYRENIEIIKKVYFYSMNPD
jgi:hypothetical protein